MFFHSSEELCERFSELLVLKGKEKKIVLSFLRKFSRRKDLFLVGGCVRALFTGERIKDIDIAVKEDIIKLQWNMKSTREKWRARNYEFYLIAHEHIFVFKKPEDEKELKKCKFSKKWW